MKRPGKCQRCENGEAAIGVLVIPGTGGQTEAVCLACYHADVQRYAAERRELRS